MIIGYAPSSALVVVDMQHDFADPAGSLYVSGGEDIVAGIAAEIAAAQAATATVVYTQDWHPEHTPHFAQDGGTWPVHCVAGSPGAALVPGVPVVGPVVHKGTGSEDGYSGFSEVDLASGERKGTQLSTLLDEAGGGAMSLLRTAVAAGLLLAAADVVVVIRRNRKKTRMSRQEIKDESKRSDGDPLLKGAIRSKQLAMSRNRMMAAIPTADVVLVNPTHVAVALRYEPGSGAPRVVAKGQGHVATRIRERATEHHVPMVADVPLARALHGACEVGDEIPEYLYTAVARVLAFVMALRRRGAAAGVHRVPDRPGVAA